MGKLEQKFLGNGTILSVLLIQFVENFFSDAHIWIKFNNLFHTYEMSFDVIDLRNKKLKNQYQSMHVELTFMGKCSCY